MAKLILLFNVFDFVWQSINLPYSIRNIICLEADIELCFSLFRHHLGAHLEHNEAMKSIKSLKHHRLDVATCSDREGGALWANKRILCCRTPTPFLKHSWLHIRFGSHPTVRRVFVGCDGRKISWDAQLWPFRCHGISTWFSHRAVGTYDGVCDTWWSGRGGRLWVVLSSNTSNGM